MFKEKAEWIDEKIFSITTLPDKTAAKKWVIFIPGTVNGENAHPGSGPVVSLARKLVSRRIASIRFDYCGKGNSYGERKRFDYNSALRDTKTVLKYITQKYGADNIRIYTKGGSGYTGGVFAFKNKQIRKAFLYEPILAPAETKKVPKYKKYFKLREDEWLALKGVPFYGRHARIMSGLPGLASIPFKNTTCHFAVILGKKDDLASWKHAEKLKETIDSKGACCDLLEKPAEEHDMLDKSTIEYLEKAGLKFLSS